MVCSFQATTASDFHFQPIANNCGQERHDGTTLSEYAGLAMVHLLIASLSVGPLVSNISGAV